MDSRLNLSSLLLLAMLAAPVRAQSDDTPPPDELKNLIQKILDYRTRPSELSSLIDDALKKDRGPTAITESLLNPETEPGIVVAAVERLLDAPPAKYDESLGAIARLLLHKDSRLVERVRARVEEMAQTPSRAPALRERLRDWVFAGDKRFAEDSPTRRGFVHMLALMHHRESLDDLIRLWQQDEAAEVRKDAEAAVQDVLDVRTPEEGTAQLRARPDVTYRQLLLERNRALRKQVDGVRQERNELLRKLLPLADFKEAFDWLARSDAGERAIAAQHLLGLVQKKKVEASRIGEFAKGMADAFRREVQPNRVVPRVLGPLLGGLDLLAARNNGVLWKVLPPAEVTKALGAGELVYTPGIHGSMANLLRRVALEDANAVAVLARMANLSPAEVRDATAQDAALDRRKAAVEAMGLVTNAERALRPAVGEKLVTLLEGEKNTELLNTILLRLGNLANAVPQVLEPVSKLLAHEEPKVSVRDCMVILRRVADRKSLQALQRLATEHPNSSVRVLAVEEGLLPRTYATTQEEQSVFEKILALLVAAESEERGQLLDAVAANGRANVVDTLLAVANEEGIAGADRAKLNETMAKVAERLASPRAGAPVAQGDFQAALRLVSRRPDDFKAADLERICRKLVDGAAALKRPAGAARWLYARALERTESPDATELLTRYRAARDSANADGLEPAGERDVLARLHKLLVGQKPAPLAEAAACSARLAELTEAEAEAAVLYLRATDEAIQGKAQEKAKAYLGKAEEKGADKAEVQERKATLGIADAATPPKDRDDG